MIKFENTEVVGWEAAIRGMRNPMNSWEKGEGNLCHISFCRHGCPFNSGEYCLFRQNYDMDPFVIGSNDHKLMMSLAKAGPVHAKYRRMITVYVDITAPLYWWKEFDTYKVGTVANSCSTMHKIHEKEFTLEDFSCEHLDMLSFDMMFQHVIPVLNINRNLFVEKKDKKYWWQMIQLLPSSYNQKRTVMLNYEVLAGIYPMRKYHKLDEWHNCCDWIESLPYSEIITGKAEVTPNV